MVKLELLAPEESIIIEEIKSVQIEKKEELKETEQEQ